MFSAWLRLSRTPGFTLAILTLALGIGANLAVFSVLDPILLRQLPVTVPAELVLLHSAGSLETVEISERAAFDRYSSQREVLAGVLADAGLVEHPGEDLALAAVAIESRAFRDFDSLQTSCRVQQHQFGRHSNGKLTKQNRVEHAEHC